MNQLHDAALGYAERSWKIFPLRNRGKEPRTANGVKDATSDAHQIEKWWTAWPTANIGLALGDPSGVDALDIDPRHGGDEEFDELLAGRELIDTSESQTGGGGRHIFFKHHPQASNNPNLRPGVEFRSTGYYVVLPPSIHPSGNPYIWDLEYGFEEIGAADLPDWLLEEMKTASPLSPTNGQPARLEEPLSIDRNTQLMSVLGALRRRGAPKELLGIVGSAIREKWMMNIDDPQNPFTEKELAGIVERAANYAPDLFAYAAQENARQLLDPSIPAIPGSPEKLKTRTLKELRETYRPTRWVVEGLFPRPGVALLQGDPGIGKTWLVLAIQIGVARGEKLLGKFYCSQGPVLSILAEEHQAAVVERMDMLAVGRGWPAGTFDDLPIHYHLDDPILIHSTDSQTVNPLLVQHIEELQPALIVLDPFRLIHDAEENDNTQMRGIMELLNSLAKIPREDAAVLVSHHVGKPKDSSFAAAMYRGRGASAIMAHADSILDIQGEFGYQVVTHAKSKRATNQPRFTIKAAVGEKSVELKYEKKTLDEGEKSMTAEKIVMEVLREAEEPLSKSRIEEIAQARGAARARVRSVLDTLVDKGSIEAVRAAGGYDRWQLAADPAPPAACCSDVSEPVIQERLIV
jgi:hypothetical protein